MTKTTIKVTKSTLIMEKILITKMDIPRTTFHRRAIDYFIESGEPIHPSLLIRNRSAEGYVEKTEMEQIYLDDGRRSKLMEIGEKYNCGITIVLFQAIMSYCCAIAPIVLGDEAIEKLFSGK